jgi:protein TonB
MSPNASIRNEYTKYLYVSLLIALLLHATAFAFWPEYVPSVYKIPVKVPDPFEVVPDYDVPQKPKEIEPPVDLADVIESEEADPEATIEPNFVSLRDLPRVIPPPLKEPTGYFGWDKEPELLQRAVPGYPDIARKAEIEGSVTVLVTIDESGRVFRAKVVHSDAAVFDEAAIRAAYAHVFVPAEQNGIQVKATISLTFRFVLRD